MLKNYKKLFLIALFVLISCGKSFVQEVKDPIVDDELNLRKSDFFEEMKGQNESNNDMDFIQNPTNLEIENIIVPPVPSVMGNGQLVSISITENTSLKDAFIELARLADIDIQIDSDINSSVILKISNKPLEMVVKTICENANLKYTYENNILKIERDILYLEDYDVDILQESDLWDTLQSGIENILTIEENKVNKILRKNAENRYKKALEEYNKKLNENLVDFGNNSISTPPEMEEVDEVGFTITLNKPASLVSIYANEKAHKKVVEYLSKTKKNYSSQVLIEAKVLEVQLKNEFSAGINWSLLGNNTKLNIGGGADALTGGIKSLTLKGPFGHRNLNAVVTAMEQFGTTRTLSSPRISTLNNQTATLDFVKKLVYFSVETERDDDDPSDITYNSTKQEDEEGAKLEITPTINTKTREIILKVKPEIRVQVGVASDPNPDVVNDVPVIQTRTLETSLKILSGDVMVIGGLMGENMEKTSGGVPILQYIPILGNLFKYKSKDRTVTETVIFIKATIIDNDEPLTKRDSEFYNKYFPNN